MNLRTANTRRKRAARNTPLRRWLRTAGKAVAAALNTPDHPWFSLSVKGETWPDPARYRK